MLKKLQTFASLYRELGLRWSAFRLAYAFRLRIGLVRLQMPMGEWSDYKKHITSKPAGRVGAEFFRAVHLHRTQVQVSSPSNLLENIRWDKQKAVEEADRILSGELKYFAHQFIKTGFPPNWHKDPVSGIELDSTKHWSQISDDHVVARAKPEAISLFEETASAKNASQRHYDIKFVWESNRFFFVHTLVRAYAASHDEKYPEAFWQLIEDWAEHNRPNTGSNWMDGQEIALRLMAWTFGYHAFLNSPSTTQLRISQFTMYVAIQTERIYKNIDYAISTRSNHTISEAFGLWLVGLLFPELKHSEEYLSLGKQLLEQEAATQIFPDGSYCMYSLNYHRFILHIYLYAIRLGEINRSPFSAQLINSVTKSIEYLSGLIDPQTGQMPVYGSNDGALVLPLNNCDFTDYRPLLQLGWYITKRELLFEPGPWDEDIFWLCGETSTATIAGNAKKKTNRSALNVLRGDSFPDGGVYSLHNTNARAFIRCTDFRARPSHADQLHVDLWIHGQNIACDAGTYLYSGEGIWRNGLAHTSAHNTVTVDGKDQMTMVSRFTWTNWAKGKVLQHNEKLWQGEHDGYKPVRHRRTVMALEGDRWLVIDDLEAAGPHQYSLHWLLNDVPFTKDKNSIHLNYGSNIYKIQTGLLEGEGNFFILRADANSTYGWRSRYYGHKEPAISLLLEANQSNARFWTFFGFEKDKTELHGRGLKINGVEIDFN